MNEVKTNTRITWCVMVFVACILLGSLVRFSGYLWGQVEYIPAKVVSDVYVPTKDIGGYPAGYGSTIPAHWYGRVTFDYRNKIYSREGNIFPFQESRDTSFLPVASNVCVVLNKNILTHAVMVLGVFAMSC